MFNGINVNFDYLFFAEIKFYNYSPSTLILRGLSFSVDLTNSKTSQSRTFSDSNSSLAIDGNVDTCSIAEQDKTVDDPPWWRVKLDRIYKITDLSIHFTSKGSCLSCLI